MHPKWTHSRLLHQRWALLRCSRCNGKGLSVGATNNGPPSGAMREAWQFQTLHTQFEIKAKESFGVTAGVDLDLDEFEVHGARSASSGLSAADRQTGAAVLGQPKPTPTAAASNEAPRRSATVASAKHYALHLNWALVCCTTVRPVQRRRGVRQWSKQKPT